MGDDELIEWQLQLLSQAETFRHEKDGWWVDHFLEAGLDPAIVRPDWKSLIAGTTAKERSRIVTFGEVAEQIIKRIEGSQS